MTCSIKPNIKVTNSLKFKYLLFLYTCNDVYTERVYVYLELCNLPSALLAEGPNEQGLLCYCGNMEYNGY